MKILVATVTVALAMTMLAGCSKHDTINASDANTVVSDDYGAGNSDQFDNTVDGNSSDAIPVLSNTGNAF
jgi:uncharacterized protein YcfL